MEMLKEFKEFALKGNVVDLAVAVIVGAAFGKIVTSLVNDVIMPLVGVLLGGLSFVDLSFTVKSAIIKYGSFIQSIVDFLIVVTVMFLTIKLINSMKRKEVPAAPAEPTTKTCPFCATEIPLKATRCPHCTSQL
jgi:large conductance mechanosensitive channel